MTTTDFTTTVTVDQTAEQAFRAIGNVRGWWSEEIEGNTEKLNDEFKYHFRDVHACEIKLTEVVPNKKVVWLVKNNYFKFTQDKSEWIGTKIIFEISEKDGKTQIRFTHQGLTPQYECYEICRDAWSNYINNSLYDLISTGKGQPNAKEGGFNEELLQQHKKTTNMKGQDYSVSIMTNASAHEAYQYVNSPSKWWTENMEGSNQKLNDEFTVRFGETFITMRVVELIPDTRVVWLVIDCYKHWLKNNRTEWLGTKICFDISEKDGKTQILFTHQGLVPEMECYDGCSDAWGGYIRQSLLNLVNTGKGNPDAKK